MLHKHGSSKSKSSMLYRGRDAFLKSVSNSFRSQLNRAIFQGSISNIVASGCLVIVIVKDTFARSRNYTYFRDDGERT